MHSSTFHRGDVTLRIGDPIPTVDLTLHDRKTVTEAAYQQVVALLHR
jgi:hypothetical protein